MDFEEYIEPSAHEVAFWYMSYSDPDVPEENLGALSQEVCHKFRALACMLLLARGNSVKFQQNLIRSARVRRDYLTRLRSLNLTRDHHSASGRYNPVCDAIAAGDIELARQIVAVSRTAWFEGHEYFDDYCFAQILHCEITGSYSVNAAEILVRYEEYLEGESDSRLEVCRALVQRSQVDFDYYFAQWINQHMEKIELDRLAGLAEEYDDNATKQIFVDALAILRLAELAGLLTESDYALCPRLARQPFQSLPDNVE